MINILIHACPDRIGYVKEHLIEKLKALSKGLLNIDLYCDDKHYGNQKAFMDSIGLLSGDGDTWHLQDDVWPSNDFLNVASLYSSVPGIICGFGTRPSCRGKSPGWTTPVGMYYSFQCIRVPNKLMALFRNYILKKYGEDPALKTDKWDDALFLEFLLKYAPFYPVLNLSPSIVEHVDYLIGGSIINKDRKYRPCAIEFGDEKSMNELIKRLEVKDANNK